MNCLAMVDSGNYAYMLCNILEKEGYHVEVVPIPCYIAKNGCGICLKFPEEYKEMVIRIGRDKKVPVREIYRIIPNTAKNKYERIY